MTTCDALIVGGGPAGSTCARALRKAGWHTIVIDRATFPRDKVCGGWITPQVFTLLDLNPAEYESAGLTLQRIGAFRTGLMRAAGVETHYSDVVSYAIRRREFDAFLLKRAGAEVREATPLTSLRRAGESWIANESIRAAVVIGAGGHFCPVARGLRDHDVPAPVVAKEAEWPLAGTATTVKQDMPELFFCDDLEGYAWCVRKGDFLNVGIGRRRRDDFNSHVARFIAFLEETGKAPQASQMPWHGHVYLASGVARRRVVADGVMLIGDAAGLAYPESGEGIRPSIESALLAAQTLIDARGAHGEDDLMPYQAALAARHPSPASTPAFMRPALTAAGRALLRSPWFARHMVIDRWFLRAA